MPCSSSRAPRDTVSGCDLVKAATRLIPPRPSARACAPSVSRHCRSSRCGFSSASMAAKRSSSTSTVAIPYTIGIRLGQTRVIQRRALSQGRARGDDEIPRLYGGPMASVKQIQVTFDCAEPERVARFWCEVLGYVVPPPPEGFATWDDFDRALPPEHQGSAFACIDPSGVGPRLFSLGAVRVRLLPADGDNESCIVMQDIEGNEFCLD